MTKADVVTVATDAGMLAMWRGSAFADVDGYEAWEEQINDRLAEAIRSGELVPIGIQGDGAFGVRVAVAPDAATQREATYMLVTSQPYLLVADGGPVFVGGIEVVGDEQSSPLRLSLPEGRYAVRAAIVAWDEEPGAHRPDGRPGPNALPDFVVTVVPSDGSETFRTSEVTFDPPHQNALICRWASQGSINCAQRQDISPLRGSAGEEGHPPEWKMALFGKSHVMGRVAGVGFEPT